MYLYGVVAVLMIMFFVVLNNNKKKLKISARNANTKAWAIREFVQQPQDQGKPNRFLRITNRFEIYDQIQIPADHTAYLYYNPSRMHNGYPGFGEPTVIKSQGDDKHDVTFTHFDIYRTNPAVTQVAVEHKDNTCNRMRLAAHRLPWPQDCLPTDLQDQCGYKTRGYKTGNYRGLPTECNEVVGNTVDSDGHGVFENPIYDIYNDGLVEPTWKYPMSAPLFLTDTTTGEQTVSMTRKGGQECEKVYMCPLDSEERYSEFKSDILQVQNFDDFLSKYDCVYHNMNNCQ